MAEFSIPYGKSALRFMLPDHWETTVLEQHQPDEPTGAPPDARPDAPGAIKKALADLGEKYAAAPGRRTVAIAINDKTRPVPHHLLLPLLLDWLLYSGYSREDVTLIIANGAHPPMEPPEFSKTVPEGILADWRVISHNAYDRDNLVHLGFTRAGTPCEVNSIFFNSDLKIVVGNIEPHQFVGWSGGVKTAAIGLGGAATITANHSMLNREGCGPCLFGDNPVRQDVEHLGRLIGVDLALNVILNENKEILDVFAGDPADVMTRGIALGVRLFIVPVDEPADLVIVSAGGYP
jgi:nickel-dependent lactate racemase